MRGNITKLALNACACTIALSSTVTASVAQTATSGGNSSAAAGSTGPGSSSSIAPAIQDAYTHMDDALNHRSTSGVFRYYAPRAVLFQLNGRAVPVSSVQTSVSQTIQKSQSVTSQTTIDNVDVQRDGTTVTLHQTINETEVNTSTGNLDTIVLHIRERDHWIQAGGQWRINRVRLLSATETVNGSNVPYDAASA